jgi:hypothetical protein
MSLSLSLQCQRVVTPVSQTEQTLTFVFDGAVQQYLVGISYFELTYGAVSHEVEWLALSLAHSLSTDNNAQINVTLLADIFDGFNNCDGFLSKVTVVVLAWITPNSSEGLPAELTIQDVRSLGDGAAGPAVAPTGQSSIQQAVLSGFNFEYLSGLSRAAYWVERVSASAATSPPTALMQDSSGHKAYSTISSWQIAASGSDPDFLVQTMLTAQQTQNPFRFEFSGMLQEGQVLVGGAVLLTGFNVQYQGQAYWVQTIGAGAEDWSISETAITATGARAFMWDNTGHNQDESQSNVSLIAIGVVGTSPVGNPG